MCESYDITCTDLNPTLFYVCKKNGITANHEHAHGNTEMLYVLSGRLHQVVDGIPIELNEGDVLIMNKGAQHRSIPDELPNNGILVFIGFSDYHFRGMEPNRFVFPDGSQILHTEGLVRQEISNLCLKMLSERYSSQAGQYFMQKSYLIQLLLILMRQYIQPKENTSGGCSFDSHHKTYVVSTIRQFLTDHYAEHISLDLIARNMYLSSAYISKIFKEETGEAPINFLIQIRLEQAKHQLETDETSSIKAIAGSVGYDDVYYFSKLFKKHFGCSPTAYREDNFRQKQAM